MGISGHSVARLRLWWRSVGPTTSTLRGTLSHPASIQGPVLAAENATGALQRRLVEYSFVGLVGLGVCMQGDGLLGIVAAKRQLSAFSAAIYRQPARVVVSVRDPGLDGIASIYANEQLLWAPTMPKMRKLMQLPSIITTER